MKHVEIQITDQSDLYGYGEVLDVFLDGQFVGGGPFGGEPEDNCRTREYSWVVPLIRDLAYKLGATVTVDQKEE